MIDLAILTSEEPLNTLLGILVIGLISLWTYKTEALDFTGTIFAAAFGLLIWLRQGFNFFLIFFFFFLLGFLASRYQYQNKSDLATNQAKRTADNVISNGLVPTFSIVLGHNFLFYGSLASALADTLSSELGVLSKSKPIDVVTLKESFPGENGAISKLGCVVSLAGGLVVSLLASFLGLFQGNFVLFLFVLTVSGFLGSLFDSLLGATLEKRGDLSNGSVNFISTLFAGLIAVLLKTVLIG